ncbi:MAG: L-aspartate oxidase [Acidobacteria bacterium]|nr:MAG: L-aspartate oxidase [Acidobacteriota bacterium]
MAQHTPTECDFLVVGAGIAGLRAAVELGEAGRVLVLAKRQVCDSATHYAQGGIAAALSDEDEVSLHLQDTLVAGDGLCNVEAVRVLVEEGPPRIEELIEWGTQFDRNGTKLAFTREGAHSRNRVLHAQGDSTGREILRALYAKAKTLKNILVLEFEMSSDLLLEDDRAVGVSVIGDGGELRQITASAVLLATGGLGQLYRNTTNPEVATGDGIAMAYLAGADVSDMELIQFHPTALYIKNAPRFLISEAVRGEGAYLRNMEMDRFMHKYHAQGDLAPRDVVARAIVHELEITRSPDPIVYLDLTHLKPDHVQHRFPRIYATCMKYNIDITTEVIPIRPAAHYVMGGILTDLTGQSSLPGLYAAGEAAANGVHGANRLASNSLLEGLVYGARAGQAMRNDWHRGLPTLNRKHAAPSNGSADSGIEELIGQIRDVMWNKVGIVRDGSGLRQAVETLQSLRSRVVGPGTRRAFEGRNILTSGLLVARSALAREESRGGHYRTDYPTHDDAKFLKHSVMRGEKISFQ